MKWSNIFKKSSDKPAQAWQFSTNIMCNGCIAKVQPILDQAEGIASWKVDLSNPHRILTIVPDGITLVSRPVQRDPDIPTSSQGGNR